MSQHHALLARDTPIHSETPLVSARRTAPGTRIYPGAAGTRGHEPASYPGTTRGIPRGIVCSRPEHRHPRLLRYHGQPVVVCHQSGQLASKHPRRGHMNSIPRAESTVRLVHSSYWSVNTAEVSIEDTITSVLPRAIRQAHHRCRLVSSPVCICGRYPGRSALRSRPDSASRVSTSTSAV